ncbi:hypothetical protein BJG88_10190 [Staphylococcus nepalensis]|uniref:DUF2977 domain-containing protein n=1 Tax=Staphylococcus nepalensis TaxID=214473 RepID=UPI000D589CDC|nr:DUF2977 domain-containing protein [Staphylococcus nepalensis]AWI44794.1 hypothetical protein BJG88_08600 [Staphylococcus nepalensis]AWI45082.1 hypothetical protein BJG88_10190 [Staphylococcus nepalensis]
MEILVQDKYIITYAQVGGVKDGIEIDDMLVPTEFFEDFKPKKYMYVNGVVISNEDYKENTGVYTPSNVEVQLASTQMQLTKTVVQLHVTQKEFSNMILENSKKDERIQMLEQQQASTLLEIAKLKGGN